MSNKVIKHQTIFPGDVVGDRDEIASNLCKSCTDGALLRCSKCKCKRYCSKECQVADWEEHKVLCSAIDTLTRQKMDSNPTMFRSHLSPTNHKKLIKLVGEKCLVRCNISGIPSRSLWDTGAMVSAVSKKWLRKHFRDMPIRDIDELLSEPLRVQAANKKSLPYSGWVELFSCRLQLTVDATFPLVYITFGPNG